MSKQAFMNFNEKANGNHYGIYDIGDVAEASIVLGESMGQGQKAAEAVVSLPDGEYLNKKSTKLSDVKAKVAMQYNITFETPVEQMSMTR